MYPDDSLQSFVSPWWVEDEEKKLSRGRLLWAYLPHVDQQPVVLIPEGRTDPTDHTKAFYRVEPFQIKNPPKAPKLPVAGLPQYPGEIRLVYRAKRRPVVVISIGGQDVPRALRTGAARWQTAPTMLVVPYYGIDPTGKRGGWRPEFVNRIRKCEYPQYLWDKLPVPSLTSESILRLDHLQTLGKNPSSFEWTQYKLSDDAINILDEWIQWLMMGSLSDGWILNDIRQGLLSME